MEKILSLKDRIHGIETSVALENNRELDFNPDSSIYFSGAYILVVTVQVLKKHVSKIFPFKLISSVNNERSSVEHSVC